MRYQLSQQPMCEHKPMCQLPALTPLMSCRREDLNNLSPS